MIPGPLSPLRPHQAAALDSLKHSIAAQHRRPMLMAPTGAGKTVLAAHIVTGALRKGNRVCFVVPALSLVDQTVERFVQNGIPLDDMGVIQGDHPLRRPQAPVQVATAQTLARRAYPDCPVVVVDEAHIRHESIDRWIDDDTERKRLFIGLSATPWSRGLGKRWDDLIIATTTAELIEQGFLSKFRVFAPSRPDLEGVRTVAGDYHEGDIAERMGVETLTADIVQTWLLRGEGRPTLCFAVNREHARALHDRFEAAGVPVAYIDANVPREERDRIGRQLEAGEIRVVVNIGCLTTGIDWDVRCLILARPTKSQILFCLDSETEILTSHGWKGIGEIKEGDCVAATKDGRGCWSRVLATVERDMQPDENWVEYDAPRANFRVTDKHRMIFKARDDASYRIAEAREMVAVRGGCYVPTAVTIEQPGVPLTDAELYFIGIMMTDGTWTATTGAISQSERYPYILDRIEDCLKSCGIGYSKSREQFHASVGAMAFTEKYPRWRFAISAGKPKPHGNQGRGPVAARRTWKEVQGETGFRHLLPYLDKDFAPALMALSRSQFLTLLGAMFDGDGAKKAGKPWCDYTPRSVEICSARKLCVDRLQALAAIHGMTANVRCENGASRSTPIYMITITDKDWRSCGGYVATGKNGGTARNARPAIEMRPATKERVWCVQSEAGTIVTRRRGKVTVMGNCQIIGRGLRTADGKDDCLILDHSDTHQRLGFVTDIHITELDDGSPRAKAKAKEREEKAAPLPKCCPSCSALMPVRVKVCGACGHEQPVRVAVEADGELAELRPGKKTKGEKRVTMRDVIADQGKQAVYSQLWGIALQRGRKPGWVAHKYREIFQVWPRGLTDTPAEPTSEVASWVVAQDIRYAKGRAAGMGVAA